MLGDIFSFEIVEHADPSCAFRFPLGQSESELAQTKDWEQRQKALPRRIINQKKPTREKGSFRESAGSCDRRVGGRNVYLRYTLTAFDFELTTPGHVFTAECLFFIRADSPFVSATRGPQ